MPLADTRFSNRRRALASNLAAQRLDALLVTNLINVRYLTNFSGSNGALIVEKDMTANIATDGRYTTQIAEEVPDIEAKITREMFAELLATVPAPARVGVEATHLSIAAFDKLKEKAPEDIDLVPVTGVVEKLRETKDEVSLTKLTEIAALATKALDDLLNAGGLAVGKTEREVAADLEYRMRTAGAERPSFDTIVASGPNSAKPHHGADDRVIENGDFVTIDFGAHLRGFNSDMTRTFIMGEESDFTREIYDLVLRAQHAGVEAARPGATLVEVDAACRSIIEEAGYGEYFNHSTGHGIGLDVHEAPYAATTGKGELAPGMTLTIEPGVYVPGKGGVRIEDTLIITEGAPRIITTFPKDRRVI